MNQLLKKETWIKIKEEYKEGLERNPNSSWMCSFSDTFTALWQEDQESEYLIKKFAQGFLTPTQIGKGWFVGEVVLFRNLDATTTEKQQIRLDFINYMIDNCNEL